MYPNTFYRVSVKALIKAKDSRVLVLKENQDTWSLPGGGLDHGEGVTDTRYIDVSELEYSKDIFEKMVYSVATNA